MIKFILNLILNMQMLISYWTSTVFISDHFISRDVKSKKYHNNSF